MAHSYGSTLGYSGLLFPAIGLSRYGRGLLARFAPAVMISVLAPLAFQQLCGKRACTQMSTLLRPNAYHMCGR